MAVNSLGFLPHTSHIRCQRTLQPRNAHGCRHKKSPEKSLLFITKGPGKGQPSTTENFQTLLTVLQAQYHRKTVAPYPSLQQRPGGEPNLPSSPDCNEAPLPSPLVWSWKLVGVRTSPLLSDYGHLPVVSVSGDHVGSLNSHPHSLVTRSPSPQVPVETELRT